jgi:hypothetical protein
MINIPHNCRKQKIFYLKIYKLYLELHSDVYKKKGKAIPATDRGCP